MIAGIGAGDATGILGRVLLAIGGGGGAWCGIEGAATGAATLVGFDLLCSTGGGGGGGALPLIASPSSVNFVFAAGVLEYLSRVFWNLLTLASLA